MIQDMHVMVESSEYESRQEHDCQSPVDATCPSCDPSDQDDVTDDDMMCSTNILIIDDEGSILLDNMNESTELSRVSTGYVIKNIEMIHWNKDKQAIHLYKNVDEGSQANISIPSRDETDVTSCEDSHSFELPLICVAGSPCETADDNSCTHPCNGKEVDEDTLIKNDHEISLELDFDSDCPIAPENEGIHAFKTVDSLLDSGYDSLEVESTTEQETDISTTVEDECKRRVHFAEEIVTVRYETPCWSPEEKACLFYTGKELHQFRIDHIIELYESQLEGTKLEDWSKFEGNRGLRVFWSFYAVCIDFMTCRALTQFCCGEKGRSSTSEASNRF